MVMLDYVTNLFIVYRYTKCIGAYEEKLPEAGVNFDKRIRKKPLETTIRLHQSQKVWTRAHRSPFSQTESGTLA